MASMAFSADQCIFFIRFFMESSLLIAVAVAACSSALNLAAFSSANLSATYSSMILHILHTSSSRDFRCFILSAKSLECIFAGSAF